MERKLVYVITVEDLIRLGFEIQEDGTEDPRGVSWHIKNEHFHLYVDAWADVFLSRLNPDTDPIQVLCDSVFDLQMVTEFIKD